VRNTLLVNVTPELTRVALLEEGTVCEVHIEPTAERRIIGNIYKGRVLRVLPGMNAAFVDIGLDRTAFLYAMDIVAPKGVEEDAVEEGSPIAKPESRGETRDVHIETLVREGQEILVQVAKEPIGSKGARVTCNMAMPGVFCVLLPSVDHVGVSRKISDHGERNRLRDIGNRVRPAGNGIILRTVAEGRTEAEIAADVEFVHGLWQKVRSGAEHLGAPALVHEDLSLLFRAGRDLVCREFDKVYVDDEVAARQLKSFVSQFLPKVAQQVEFYQNPVALFDAFNVEQAIARAMQRRVNLASGGYIVIERTEALTAIDVNSGRSTGKADLETNILQTNLEAVKEIAYQVRLRNIGGIIVVDFIDMTDTVNQTAVRSALVDELKRDPAKSRVLPMSELGLVEFTRKRVTESLVSRLTEHCFYCEGRGYLKSAEMVAHGLMAKIKKNIKEQKIKKLKIHANPKVVEAITRLYLPAMERLEKSYKRPIELMEREDFHLERTEVFGDLQR